MQALNIRKSLDEPGLGVHINKQMFDENVLN